MDTFVIAALDPDSPDDPRVADSIAQAESALLAPAESTRQWSDQRGRIHVVAWSEEPALDKEDVTNGMGSAAQRVD